MATLTPAQLAQHFEFSTSTGTLSLTNNTDIGGVDRFQVGFNTAGASVYDLAYVDLTAVHVDLTDFTQVRFAVRVSVAGTAQRLRMQYSLDGSAYTTLTNDLALTVTGLQRTDWETLPAAANTVVSVRVGVGIGDGMESITLSGTVMEFRR